MARRPAKAEQPEQYTLYDIDPRFQSELMTWLAKKNVIVDIGVTGPGDDRGRFHVTCDPGGEMYADSFEEALVRAMGKRSRSRHVDPQLEDRVYEFLAEHGAHLTFGATKQEFNVMVGNPDASGKATDEDLEVAIILAEEEFWERLPTEVLSPAKRAELAAALVPRVQREEEAQEQLQRALLEPRAELEANQGPGRQRFLVTVDGQLASGDSFGFMSREEARAWGETNLSGPYEIRH